MFHESSHNLLLILIFFTCESFGLVRGDGALGCQITLIPHQHDDNVRVSMVVQLLQPALHALVGQVFADVVHQQSSNRTSVIPEQNISHHSHPRLGPRPHPDHILLLLF